MKNEQIKEITSEGIEQLITLNEGRTEALPNISQRLADSIGTIYATSC